ncbi:MAG: GNAT family N-acetyltransferase [Streptosporangiaceae bacterium]
MTISIPDLEQRAALGWRAPEEERLGDWLLRAAGGFTGRANSALATGDPGSPLDQAAGAVQDWYQARGLPAMIAVSYPAGRAHAAPADRFLAERGWSVRSGAATVMTAPAGQVARVAGSARTGAAVPAAGGRVPGVTEAPIPVALDPEPSEDWLALYHYRGQPSLPPIARQVLTSAPWQAFASVRDGGETVAIGRVAAAAGWAGLTAIEVAPGHRRRGLATAITAALAAQAAAHGAGHLYLQVEDDNEAAQALYHRNGFSVHHGYHYRIAAHHSRNPAEMADRPTRHGPGGCR